MFCDRREASQSRATQTALITRKKACKTEPRDEKSLWSAVESETEAGKPFEDSARHSLPPKPKLVMMRGREQKDSRGHG